MHTVIKSTKTIAEYKALKASMEQRAREHFESHRGAVEDWQEGDILKVWIDGDGVLCIEYESGNWWHYGETGEWW